jgi:hypothetical protein
MLWLIWIVLMILVPIGAGVHVWWQLHHVPQTGAALLQAAHHPPHEAANSSDGAHTY